MLFTPADVARLQFSEDGRHAVAYVVLVSQERPDGENHVGITIDLPLEVQPGETIAELRARAIATAESLLRVETAPSASGALRTELQSRVNNLLARAPERWMPKFALRDGQWREMNAWEGGCRP